MIQFDLVGYPLLLVTTKPSVCVSDSIIISDTALVIVCNFSPKFSKANITNP